MLPNGLTTKQNKLVRALASGKAGSQREAAKIAGMHEVTASQVLTNAKVKNELARLMESREDKARRIAGKSSAVVLEALDSQPCSECGQSRVDPMFALATWKTSAEVVANAPPQTETLAGTEADTAELAILQAVAVGIRLGARIGARALDLVGSRAAHLEAVEGRESIEKLRSVRDLVQFARGESKLD